jgi:indole-3-acetate monooxygenase
MPPADSPDPALLESARRAAHVVRLLAPETEAARRLPAAAVQALVEAGVFKLILPRALGGGDASLATLLSVIEEIARADGSAGWVSMIGASSALMCGFLDEPTAREVYGPADAITCGVFAPLGRATPTDGGFRVSGRWPFASGSLHAQWCMGGAIVEGQEKQPNGAPAIRSLLFRSDEIRVLDNWDVSGLRGSGSNDFEVQDVFVPASRAFSLLTDRPRLAGPIFRQPFFGVLASGVAAVTLGIARAAIDTFIELARTKQSLGARRSLAHREVVQLEVGRAEAELGAARAFLFESAARAAEEVADTGAASLATRARVRLASSHAATAAASAVDRMYAAGGGTSIYAKSPLQRQFRDLHTATQHLMISPTITTTVGRLLLGVDVDTETL